MLCSVGRGGPLVKQFLAEEPPVTAPNDIGSSANVHKAHQSYGRAEKASSCAQRVQESILRDAQPANPPFAPERNRFEKVDGKAQKYSSEVSQTAKQIQLAQGILLQRERSVQGMQSARACPPSHYSATKWWQQFGRQFIKALRRIPCGNTSVAKNPDKSETKRVGRLCFSGCPIKSVSFGRPRRITNLSDSASDARSKQIGWLDSQKCVNRVGGSR